MVEKGIKRPPPLQREDFVDIVTARDPVEAYAKTPEVV